MSEGTHSADVSTTSSPDEPGPMTLGAFLLAGPGPDLSDLDLERSNDVARTVDFDLGYD